MTAAFASSSDALLTVWIARGQSRGEFYQLPISPGFLWPSTKSRKEVFTS